MGSAIVGGIASWFSSSYVMGSIGTIVAGAINGALIGAVVGGLTTALNGGDIGKGILYGAVGGAVLGGSVSAWTGNVFASSLEEGILGTGEKATPQRVTETKTDADGKIIERTTTTEKTPGWLSGGTGEVIGKTLSGVATGLLSPKDEGIDYGKQAAAQLAVNQQQLDAQAAENALQRKARMDELEKQLASTDVNTAAQLAEQRRQYDVSATAAAARQRDAATGRGVLTIGQGTEATAAYDPALQNVLDNKLYTNVAGA